MSRLTLEVSSEQHQQIKVMAAMKGQTIKDYIIGKLFHHEESQDERAAWETLKTLLDSRLEHMKNKGVSPRTVQEVTEHALKALGKAS